MNIKNYMDEIDKLDETMNSNEDTSVKNQICENLRDKYNGILLNTRTKLNFGDKIFTNYNTLIKEVEYQKNDLQIKIYSYFYKLSEIKELQVNNKYQEINILINLKNAVAIEAKKDFSLLLMYMSDNQIYLMSQGFDSDIKYDTIDYNNIELKVVGSVLEGEIPHKNKSYLI